MELPIGAEPGIFILSDGRLNSKSPAERQLGLDALVNRYLTSVPKDSKASTTVRTEEIHALHLLRHLRKSKLAQSVTTADMQAYVEKRLRDAVKQVRDGRRVGGRLNVRDVSSEYAQQAKRFVVERLDRYDAEEGKWREVLIEDRKAGPADSRGSAQGQPSEQGQETQREPHDDEGDAKQQGISAGRGEEARSLLRAAGQPRRYRGDDGARHEEGDDGRSQLKKKNEAIHGAPPRDQSGWIWQTRH